VNNIIINNIYDHSDIEFDFENEFFENLLIENSFKIERIISTGQQTPQGIWLDENTNEFVLLLDGNAEIKFYGDEHTHNLQKGDWCIIPKNTKHRVEYTDKLTYWLAVHYE